jgi:hypothetical protein
MQSALTQPLAAGLPNLFQPSADLRYLQCAASGGSDQFPLAQPGLSVSLPLKSHFRSHII